MKFPSLFTLTLVVVLSGCFFESVRPVDRNLKPYGAHWIKDGMTREERRIDLAVCGSINHEDVRFLEDRIQAARLPTDPNEINANLRLRDHLGDCMRAKGYQSIGSLKFLDGCDARCMHP